MPLGDFWQGMGKMRAYYSRQTVATRFGPEQSKQWFPLNSGLDWPVLGADGRIVLNDEQAWLKLILMVNETSQSGEVGFDIAPTRIPCVSSILVNADFAN